MRWVHLGTNGGRPYRDESPTLLIYVQLRATEEGEDDGRTDDDDDDCRVV